MRNRLLTSFAFTAPALMLATCQPVVESHLSVGGDGFDWDACDKGYSSVDCIDQGEGSFEQFIPKGATVTIGDITAGKTNVRIDLKADVDVDAQLYDGLTAIVMWPSRLQRGPDRQETTYQGMRIVYSGYKGGVLPNGDRVPGHEYIEVRGELTRTLTMKAFGYAEGYAEVTYSWGYPLGLLIPVAGKDYFLEEVGTATVGSDENGCHGQGIKFDGRAFYTSCMETHGNDNAYVYVHSAQGGLIHRYQYDDEYDHPSGLLLHKERVYFGFTHLGIDMYSRLYRMDVTGHTDYLGFFDHSVGSVGLSIMNADAPDSIAYPRMYSFDQYYERQCFDLECSNFEDETTAHDIDGKDGIQDCDRYYEGGQWYKACILFSTSPNRIRVWRGDELRLDADNALRTLVMHGEPGHSGGLGFYRDPTGVKWIVTAPPPETNRRRCGGCFLVGSDTCACTDKDNRQRVRFSRFDSLDWPPALPHSD